MFRSKELGNILGPWDVSTYGSRVLFPGKLGREDPKGSGHCMRYAGCEPKRSDLTCSISFLELL